MSYTVWLDGTLIGESNLELRHGGRRRAGIFHPTDLGLSVLPGITAMGPALLDTGRACKERGINTDDDSLLSEEEAEQLFTTGEGKRVIEAAKVISRLEVRNPAGDLIEWESILISDMNELAAAARRESTDPPDVTGDAREAVDPPGRDPVRYFMSATFGGETFSQRLRRRVQRVMS